MTNDRNHKVLEEFYTEKPHIDNKIISGKTDQTNNVIPESKASEQQGGNQINLFDDKKGTYTKPSRQIKVSNGDQLEYRLKRLMFGMGYFSKVGVIIKTSADEKSDMITDLDVYGHYIHKNFAIKTLWADCKSGQAKPLERISWLVGVKNIIGIDDVIFVKKGVRTSTKQFARNLGVQILELGIIEKLEKDFNIDTGDWSGSWNPQTQLNKLSTFQKLTIPQNETFKRIANFITTNYWTFDSFSKVKKTITALKQLAEIEQYHLKEEELQSVHWAIFELINLFVLATLDICREVYYFSEIDRKETIINGLVSGELSGKKRKEIVEAVYKTAYSMIQKQVPGFNLPLQIPELGMAPPPYSEGFNDLISRITNKPLQYFDILRFIDYVFMEFDLQSKELNKDKLKMMFSNYDDLVVSSKTIIHFICAFTGIRKELFHLLS